MGCPPSAHSFLHPSDVLVLTICFGLTGAGQRGGVQHLRERNAGHPQSHVHDAERRICVGPPHHWCPSHQVGLIHRPSRAVGCRLRPHVLHCANGSLPPGARPLSSARLLEFPRKRIWSRVAHDTRRNAGLGCAITERTCQSGRGFELLMCSFCRWVCIGPGDAVLLRCGAICLWDDFSGCFGLLKCVCLTQA